MPVTAIFDIGKTNKKFFLFDEHYRQVYKAYSRFEEIADDDGYPADNLPAIQHWLKELFEQILHAEEHDIKAINFSTYGASFVHVDREGRPVTPLYNYTKPYLPDILQSFHDKYGDADTIASATASPASGMLNSGFQLYWLKYAKPEVFAKIRWSLHFPQYLSFLFTGIPVSDYTSVGCHTSLWDYAKGDYHDWVYAEEIDRILPPLVATNTSINMDYQGKRMRIGVGIHDSSAALLPYLRADKTPFLLISTGTWSISLNPFSEEILSEEDLRLDCLNYMRIDGKPVKASRLFLGQEYRLQTEKLCDHFGKDYGDHRHIHFDEELYGRLTAHYTPKFHFSSLRTDREQPAATDYAAFSSFEEAFHQLMIELMELQVISARHAIGTSDLKKVYIDGGFTDNDIYVKLLSHHLNGYKLRTTQSPLGSALGAAMVISDKKIDDKFLQQHYAMRKHEPLILK